MTFGDRMAFPRVELHRNSDGEYLFRILNRHGAVIANSVGFDSKARMRGALRTVLQMAPWAAVDDLSKNQPASTTAGTKTSKPQQKAAPAAKEKAAPAAAKKAAPAAKEKAAPAAAKKAAPAKKSASKPARTSPKEDGSA
jgi:uncharacterized protein YegP (UPF0339 family)